MIPRILSLLALIVCAVWSQVVSAQASPAAGSALTVPERIIRIKIDNDAPLKVRTPVRAHTLEPLFINNRLVLPIKTSIDGEISSLGPASRGRQMEAYAHGDFTPLKQATLHFYRAIDPAGNVIPLVTGDAQLATTTVFLQSQSVQRPSFAGRWWQRGVDEFKSFSRQFTEPGRIQRGCNYVYSQLPNHPQSLVSGTEFDLPILREPELPHRSNQPPRPAEYKLPDSSIQVHSRLVTALDSGIAKRGDTVLARVVQPIVGQDGHLIVPQGTLIRGSVLQTTPGRRWGRAGTLRFTFSEMILPTGETRQVAGVPRAIYSEPGSTQVLDSEGGVKPQSTPSMLAPLILAGLATHSVNSDENRRGNATLSSNGFGVVARVVAVGSGSTIFGGVIGGAASARAVYSRFIARSRDVEFPVNTPIEIELSPVDAPILRGSGPPRKQPVAERRPVSPQAVEHGALMR